MGFLNQLTDDNKKIFRDMLKTLFYMRNLSTEINSLFLAWFYEYFCQYLFINTKDDSVTTKEVKKRLHKLGYKDIVGLIESLRRFRDTAVHNPYNIGRSQLQLRKAFKNFNTDENIELLCNVFEEDAKDFESYYKSAMRQMDCIN